jgi:hypothetical protein
MRTVVLPARDRCADSFLVRSLDGVCVTGPVPVKVHSEMPRSRCFGDCLLLAILDLGDCLYATFDTDLDTEREK